MWTGRELRSDHSLLAVGLKVTDDLRNYADQLAGDVGHILLRQLSLLAKGHGTAERRLELRRPELSTPTLCWMAETRLAEASGLAQTEATLHGRKVRLLLALQHSHDLRNDGQDLTHDLVHVLSPKLALLAAPLLTPSHRLPAAPGVISKSAKGLLTAVLPILLAIGRLPESKTALSKTALR